MNLEPIFELEHDGDDDQVEELETPLSTSDSSSTLLKSRPKNYTRGVYPKNSSDLSTVNVQERASSPEPDHEDDDDTDDAAEPPPPIRTRASLESFSTDTEDIRDSIDEAVPPPIRAHSDQAAGTWYNNQTLYTPTQNVASSPLSWIYKPYTGYRDSFQSSIASSEETDRSCDTFASEDTNESIADSEAGPESVKSGQSSISDFAYQGRLGWIVTNGSIAKDHNQRWSGSPSLRIATASNNDGKTPTEQHRERRTGSIGSIGSIGISPTSPSFPRLKSRISGADDSHHKNGDNNKNNNKNSNSNSNDNNKSSDRPKRSIPLIVKRVSLDQISEHINPYQADNMSDGGGSISSNEWSSSDVDTSVLSVEKIYKLRKKGINPALYVEMQNSRKGKKWINPLGGSSYTL